MGWDLGAALKGAVNSAVSFGSSIVSRISRAFAPHKDNVGGFTKNTGSNTENTGDSGDSGNGTSASGGDGSGGSESGGSGGTDTSSDNTKENVMVNDPEKNKRLAEVRMMEELRETMNVTFRLPRILKGLHTNSWLFMDVSDEFYEANYGRIMEKLASMKYGRYAGFKKGRFFIEKVVEKGGVDGTSMEITVNPIASSYGTYVKMQLEAEKALVQALNDDNRYSGNGGYGSGGAINANGVDCSDDHYESHNWAGHKSNPPKCTTVSKVIRGNSSRQYAKDTAAHNSTSRELVEYVSSQCLYQYYANNLYGSTRCPEQLWTGPRPIRGNCADYARLLKCILDVNGYKSIICHIPGHFYNAIWENGDWTVCDLCATLHGNSAYGHANHGNIKPIGTWDSTVTGGERDA